MSSRYHRVGALVLLSFVHLGCSSDSSPADESTLPTSGPVTVFGRVSLDGKGLGADPVAQAQVSVRGDFNADGAVAADEVATAITDAKGQYRLTFEMKGKGALVAHFSASTLLGTAKRVVITPPSNLRIDASLSTAEALESSGVFLKLPDDGLRLRGLPDGYSGVARRFDPARESFAFPGTFSDNQGARLVSAVFAKVEIDDAAGQPVHQLSSPSEMQLEVPRNSWPVIRDTTSGNGKIDVPFYGFDEEQGQWVLDSQAHLVDDRGDTIPESQLGAITSGKFDGRVVAVAKVTHFSNFNVDFPQTCGGTSADVYGDPSQLSTALGECGNRLKGKAKITPSLMDRISNWLACAFGLATCQEKPPPTPGKPQKKELQTFDWKPPAQPDYYGPGSTAQASTDGLTPLSGAWVTAEYYDAAGNFTGYVAGEIDPDGSFDIPIGRSEAPGEDVDQNGVAGEVRFARIVVDYSGFRFLVAAGEIPSFDGMVADLGDDDLSDSLLGSELCTLSGKVTYLDGSPAEGADVSMGSLGTVDEMQWDTVCGGGGSACQESVQTAADGTFSITSLVADGVQLQSSLDTTAGPAASWYWGRWASAFELCPATPVKLVLTDGATVTSLTLTVTGTDIAWDPTLGVETLWVWGPDDITKWRVSAGASPLTSPITYGTLPAGASEDAPAVGKLSSGDYVFVEASRTAASGYQELASGETTVP